MEHYQKFHSTSVFVRVVEAGSFTRASHQLQMPKSTVSHKIKELEIQLGFQLLKRTTRKLVLTELGEHYYKESKTILQSFHDLQSSLLNKKSKAQGLLRITTPVELGTSILIDYFSGFKKRYPDIVLDLIMSDRLVDLVGENIDVAIRAGALPDSSMISKRLGTGVLKLFASPSYLKSIGKLNHVSDLNHKDAVVFSPTFETGFKLLNKNKQQMVDPHITLQCTNLTAAREFTVKGLGYSLLPEQFCREEIRNGKLVNLFPDWFAPGDYVHLLYPYQKYLPTKVRVFIDDFSEHIKEVF